ncbi:hypothetical protein CYMTET_35506, partial [Cymbomonas tetramitiformis]
GRHIKYGEAFGEGDIVFCVIDREAKPETISYFLNGEWLGVALTIDEEFKGVPVYPHVMCRNMVVTVSFDGGSPRHLACAALDSAHDFRDCSARGTACIALDGTLRWGSNQQDGGGQRCLPLERVATAPAVHIWHKDVMTSQLLMMVGLPASGKTTWARNYASMRSTMGEQVIMLGTDLALEMMQPRGHRRTYRQRFATLMKFAQKIFQTHLNLAMKRPGVYIIDQTNCYHSARKRKVEPFLKANFEIQAIVVVSKEEERLRRAELKQREEDKRGPDESVKEMMMNFELPHPCRRPAAVKLPRAMPRAGQRQSVGCDLWPPLTCSLDGIAICGRPLDLPLTGIGQSWWLSP